MTALESKLLETLKRLPAARVAEAVDFVEFLAAREERAAAARRVTAALARLDALNSPPPTEEEVAAELKAARSERRERAHA